MHGNNRQVIDCSTELTQMKVAFGTFHYRPHPVLRLIAGDTLTRKSRVISIESGIAIPPIYITYMALELPMTNL